jgi:hypothetical protein
MTIAIDSPGAMTRRTPPENGQARKNAKMATFLFGMPATH